MTRALAFGTQAVLFVPTDADSEVVSASGARAAGGAAGPGGGGAHNAGTGADTTLEGGRGGEAATGGRAPISAPRPPATAASAPASSSGGEVLYRGSVGGLPDEHASRRERFAELDGLQPGWEVELKNKGSTVEAVFYAPNGEKVGAFANARRMALAAHKSQQA